jgi:hypothetical protein
MVNLIDKAIVINGKHIRLRGKYFIQAIKKVTHSLNYLPYLKNQFCLEALIRAKYFM